MDFYGFNISAKDIWAKNTNVFKINGLTSNEWVDQQMETREDLMNLVGNERKKAKSKLFSEYWKIRQETKDKHIARVFGNSPNPGSFPIEDQLKLIKSNSPESVRQILSALPEWEKFENIVNTEGVAIGFDLETIGTSNAVNVGTNKELPFAITEVGLGSRQFSNGELIKTEGEAFAFGFQKGSKEDDFIRNAIDKFKSGGWGSLDSTEAFSLERITKYRGQDGKSPFIKKQISFLNNQWLHVSEQLQDQTHNISDMEAGLSNLRTLGKEQQGDYKTKAYQSFIDYIKDINSNNETSMYGANSKFDIAGFSHVAKQLGLDFSKEFVPENVLDIVYAVRTMANELGMSPESFNETFFDKRVGASVENLLDAGLWDKIQTHFSYDDIVNEGDVLYDSNYKGKQSFAQSLIDSVTEYKNDPTAIREYSEDTVFLINRGAGFDKNKMDSASIHGDITQSFSAANEYWKIDTAHTGMYTNDDGQEKFILSMVSPLDSDVKFLLEKDSMEDAIKHLENNTTWFKEGQVTKAQMKEAVDFKYKEFGRRTFDNFLDPSNTGRSGREYVGGSADLKRITRFNDKFNEWAKTTVDNAKKNAKDPKSYKKPNVTLTRDYKGIAILDQFISETYENPKDSPMNSYYQKQAFLGMKERLDSEESLIKVVQSSVNKNKQEVRKENQNLVDTISTKEAYNAAINILEEEHTETRSKNAKVTAQDVFGVDVQLQDGSIKRVNAQKVNVATQDINRILGNLSYEENKEIIADLGRRNIITTEQVSKFSNDLQELGNNYGVYQDMAFALNSVVDKYNDSVNPIKDFKKAYRTGEDQTIIRPIYQSSRDASNRRFRSNNDRRKFYDINQIYGDDIYGTEEVQSELKTRINDAINEKTLIDKNMTFIDTGQDKFGIIDITRNIAQDLNIPKKAINSDSTWAKNFDSPEHRIFYNMFEAYDLDKKEYKPYAISGYKEQGLRTFIVGPQNEGGSAYLLMTNEANASIVADKIINNEYDFSTRQNLIDSGVYKHAAYYEIPQVTRHEIEKASGQVADLIGTDTFAIETIKQSPTYEKFLMPKLEVHMGKGEKAGKLEAYMNSGVYDFYSAFIQSGGSALPNVVSGDFEKASKILRRNQNAKMREMSASSSYRTRRVQRVVNGETRSVVERVTSYNVSDYFRSYQADISDGLETIFRHIVTDSSEDDSVIAKNIVEAFGTQIGIEKPMYATSSYYSNIMDQSTFKEFFTKRILHDISDDNDIKNYIIENGMSGLAKADLKLSLFDIIRNNVLADKDGKMFDASVVDSINAIDKIKTELKDQFNQVGNDSSIKHGIWSLAKPGDFNVNAGLYSTMRPTYGQQNNAMMFSSDMFTLSLNFDDHIKKESSKIYNKASTITRKELDAKINVAKAYNTLGDNDYENYERQFMSRYKQMSDYELQLKYAKMESNSAKIAKKLEIEEEVFNKGLEYMRKDLMSLTEGKLFHAPELQEQGLFTDIEGEKLEINTDTMDRDKTKKILDELVESRKEIGYGDIIGKTVSGDNIYHEGAKTILEEFNVNELMGDDGMTHIIPTQPLIRDVKLMINGAEKGTSQSLVIENFMKYSGIDNYDKAFKVMNSMFYELSDGASIIGNLGFTKHSNKISSDNIYNTIVDEYIMGVMGKDGKTISMGSVLANEFNTLIKENQDIYARVDGEMYNGRFLTPDDAMFEYNEKKGQLIMNGSFANPVAAYDDLLSRIESNSFGDSAVNKRIVDSINYMKKNNIGLVRVQRQHQNEHMAKKMRLDKRIEQNIRNRLKSEEEYYLDTNDVRERLKSEGVKNADNIKIKDGIAHGVNGLVRTEVDEAGNKLDIGYSWDDLSLNALKENANNYTGRIKNVTHDVEGVNSHIINDVVDVYTKNKFDHRRKFNKTDKFLQRTVQGIIEAGHYSVGLKENVGENIVNLDLKTIRENSNLKNITVSDIGDVIFFKDGQASPILQRIADQQDVDLSQSKTIRLSLEGMIVSREVENSLGEKETQTFKDILIPIQEKLVIDNRGTTMTPKETNAFLHRFMEAYDNASGLTDKERFENLSNAYNKFAKDIAVQLDYTKKDSLVYKGYNSTILPNSSGFLAQDEVSGIVDEMFDDDMQGYISDRNTYERMLNSGNLTKEKEREITESLDKVYAGLDEKLGEISKRIEGGENLKITALGFTDYLKQSEVNIKDANGVSKKYYGYVAALNREGFEAAGIDFGLNGFQMLDDLEYMNREGAEGTFSGMNKLNPNYSNYQKDIAKKLNALEINGLDIDPTKDIIPQFREYLENSVYAGVLTEEVPEYEKAHPNVKRKASGQKLQFDTRALNEAIANKDNKSLSAIFGAFDGVTEDYLKTVGIHGILQRYPAFKSQPMAKYVYDPTMDGKGLQMRIFSPIASAFTNVDFDGDTLMAAFNLNGPVLLRKDNASYKHMAMAYRSAAKTFNKVMAEVIKDADAINRDDINFGSYQMSNMLETFRRDEYNAALTKYAVSMGYGSDISKLTKAQIFAAKQSKPMMDAFYKLKFNTLTDEQVIIASTTPAMRKINIGSVSTPNFKIRIAIDEAMNNVALSEEKRKEIRSWADALSTMKDSKGGLLSITEQKGIDVKHVVDAMNVAQTVRWSSGISKLYTQTEVTKDANLSAIKDLLISSKTSLFKDIDKDKFRAEVDMMAKNIVNRSFSDYQKLINTETDKDIVKRLKTEQSFRALIELQSIKEFVDPWQRIQASGSFEKGMISFWQEFFENHDSLEYKSKFRGTVLDEVTRGLQSFSSGEKPHYQKDHLYFHAGQINGITDEKFSFLNTNKKDTAFLYRGKGKFEIFNLKKNQLTGKVIDISEKRTPKEINKIMKGIINTSFGGANYKEFIENQEYRDGIKRKTKYERYKNLLNDALLDSNGNVRKTLNRKFDTIDYDKFTNKAGGLSKQEIEDAKRMFSDVQDGNRRPRHILDDINDYVKAFDDYAMEHNIKLNMDGISKDKISTGADLIRAMNEEIASNYTPGQKSYDSFDKELRKRIIKHGFKSEEVFNNYLKATSILGTEEKRTYTKSIEELKNNIYNILDEQQRLEDSFKDVELNLNSIEKDIKDIEGLSEKELEKINDVVAPLREKGKISKQNHAKVIKELKNKNKKATDKAEKNVYNLFKDTENFNKYFRFNKVSGDSIVGFGEYLGTAFSSLSKKDIESIKAAAIQARKELETNATAKIRNSNHYKIKANAVTETLNKLTEYEKNFADDIKYVAGSGLKSTVSKEVSDILIDENTIGKEVFTNYNNLLDELKQSGSSAKRKTTTQRSVGGTILDSLKGLAEGGISPKALKTAGVVVGAMAAIGVTNNLLHGQKRQSPLTPSRKKDGSENKPNTFQKYVDGPQIQYKQQQLVDMQHDERMLKKDLSENYGIETSTRSGAPSSVPTGQMSGKVYHHNSSGLNFKVSAKTQNKINDENNAKIIGMAGGGENVTVFSQSDTSGVTDNWLSNKFAELV